MSEGQPDSLPIEWSGAQNRRGALSWAQASTLEWLNRNLLRTTDLRENLDLNASILLRSQTSPEVLISRLRQMITCHDFLRTRFARGETGDSEQVVESAGVLKLLVADDEAALREAVCSVPLEIYGDFPIRMGVLVRGGCVEKLEVAVSRLIVDGWGYYNMNRCLGAVLNGIGRSPAPGFQQLDRVAFENSVAGKHRSLSGSEYRRRVAAELMSWPQSDSMKKVWPVVYESTIEAKDISIHCNRIARRGIASPSSVLLASFCEVIAERLSLREFAVVLHSANRFEKASALSITRLKSETVMIFKRGSSLYDSAASVYRASFAAYRNAEIAPTQAHHSGINTALNVAQVVRVSFNDKRDREARRLSSDAGFSHSPTECDECLETVVVPKVRETVGSSAPYLGAWVSHGRNDPGAVSLKIATNVLSSADTRQILLDIYFLLRAAACAKGDDSMQTFVNLWLFVCLRIVSYCNSPVVLVLSGDL